MKRSNKRMHLDMRASKGYTQELEKINQDHRELTLKINFKTPITKKRAFGFMNIQNAGISIF